MKFSAGFAALSLLLAAATTVAGSSVHDGALQQRHHHGVHHASSAAKPKHSSHNVRHHSHHGAHHTSSAAKPEQSSHNSPSTNPNPGPAPPTHGTINPSNPGQCNPVGATLEVTTTSGPNGHIDWLNCGVNGQGWSPAPVKLQELVVVPLENARQTTFAPCSDEIIATFIKYGNQYNIPPIVLASFAMQESSCNPNTVGGAGEQGLMQITPDKCKGAPSGNCKDIDFNIRTGAEYFVSILQINCDDILLTIGEYNGWKHGMTYTDATSAAHTCCRCQNNLDYLHEFVNGWLQGVNAYEKGLGKYHNLDNC